MFTTTPREDWLDPEDVPWWAHPWKDPGLNHSYDAVGRCVQACQHLEFWLVQTATSLLPPKPGERDRHTRLSTSPISSVIRALRPRASEVLGDDLRDLLIEVLDKSEDVLELRHAVVHGMWGRDTLGRQVSTRPVPARKAKTFHKLADGTEIQKWATVPLDRPAMLELAVDAYALATQLEGLAFELLNREEYADLMDPDRTDG